MSELVTWATEDLQDVMSPRYRQMHMDDKSSTWKQFPIPLYTHPQKELTDGEILEIADSVLDRWSCNSLDGTIIFARAIIKAMKGEK
jgi:hypothetical protein